MADYTLLAAYAHLTKSSFPDGLSAGFALHSFASSLACLRAILLAELWPHSPAESIKGGFRIISDTIRVVSFQV